MPTIDIQRKRITSKIVYYGPGLSGKSASLQYIAEHLGSDRAGRLVSLTTQGEPSLKFEVLPVKSGKLMGMDSTFALVAVPGQAFYNRPRKVLLKAADGVVFVADSRRSRHEANIDSLENLRQNLQSYGITLQQLPHVIQYNKRDVPDALSPAEMRRDLNPFGVPEFEVSIPDGTGVLEALASIIGAVGADLESRM